MQEFEFVVRFDPGADPLMDVFREYPGLSAWSSTCFATADAMWRIDHIKGPAEGLSAVDDLYLDESRCNECLDQPDCHTPREYHVLESARNARTVYTFRREIHRCHSIPYIVLDHVGEGCVFEARRVDDEYRWKVLYPGDQQVGELYDAIEEFLRDGLALEVSHLREAGNWSAETRTAAQLSHGHWEALEAAYEAGYYQRPRDVTVADLADELDLPRSTVQYRLRKAEDVILSEFVADTL